MILDNIEEIRAYCLSKKGSTEDLPFGEFTLVFKVMGKIFAILPLDEQELRVNLKCDPERALDLRERHPDILPGYHMNKKHWNTIHFDGDLTQTLKQELIDHSYDLVISKLPRSLKEELYLHH